MSAKRIYLFGYPLDHSVSPAMQNAALAAVGLADVRYEKLALPAEDLERMLSALRANDCIGANVTIPYKAAILPHVSELSPTARVIGAVNTIIKRDGKLIGDNTDVYGFLRSLDERSVHVSGKEVVILGAGGAAAAAAFALATLGARRITLLNRTRERAAHLVARLSPRFPRSVWNIDDWDALEHAALVVNSTPIGMAPHSDESPLPPGRSIGAAAAAFDLVYNPPVTPFLEQAAAAGAKTIGGLDMLVYQGARAFELWLERPAPVEVMREAAFRALESTTST